MDSGEDFRQGILARGGGGYVRHTQVAVAATTQQPNPSVNNVLPPFIRGVYPCPPVLRFLKSTVGEVFAALDSEEFKAGALRDKMNMKKTPKNLSEKEIQQCMLVLYNFREEKGNGKWKLLAKKLSFVMGKKDDAMRGNYRLKILPYETESRAGTPVLDEESLNENSDSEFLQSDVQQSDNKAFEIEQLRLELEKKDSEINRLSSDIKKKDFQENRLKIKSHFEINRLGSRKNAEPEHVHSEWDLGRLRRTKLRLEEQQAEKWEYGVKFAVVTEKLSLLQDVELLRHDADMRDHALKVIEEFCHEIPFDESLEDGREYIRDEWLGYGKTMYIDTCEFIQEIGNEYHLRLGWVPYTNGAGETALEDVEESFVEEVQESFVEDVQEVAVEDVQESAVEDVQEVAVEDVKEVAVENVQEAAAEDLFDLAVGADLSHSAVGEDLFDFTGEDVVDSAGEDVIDLTVEDSGEVGHGSGGSDGSEEDNGLDESSDEDETD